MRVALLALLLGCGIAVAAEFPNLSGRVVDSAGLLSNAAEGRLTNRLSEHESRTTNQVVVVTMPDLAGATIEEFGVGLGRHWGIGQADKDNGALLIVAVSERKVRIEVGYGLEGALTDAIASNIIRHRITPRFKQGQFENGIEAGVVAMLAAIEGEYQAVVPSDDDAGEIVAVIMLIAFVVLIILIVSASRGGRGGGKGAWALPITTATSSSSWGSGGGFGGGGFGGGGGGFGGGGASGGW